MGSTPSAPPADSAGLAGGLGSGTMAPIPDPKGRKATETATAPAYPLIVRRRTDGTLEISMRPIANPEDMSAAERRRVYGNRYAPRPTVAWSPRRLWRGDDTPKPVAGPAAKPAPVAKAAVAPAKPLVAVAPAAKPVAPLKTAPVVAPAAIVAAKPASTPAEQLSAAVRPEVMKGAVLTVPEGLAKGEEAKVSLALPANLMDVIKREAAKLGLGKAAKKAEVSASLTGEGYEITPDGGQTQPLKAGEAARFDWMVKPGAGDKAPLKAAVDGTLTGDKTAKTTFSLASLEQAVAPVVEDAKAAAKGFKLPSLSLPKLSLKSLAIPGMKPVTLPGVGQVPSEKLVGAGLALLALLLVIAMARSASAGRGRAERRRKFRTMQDYGRVEADPEPAHAPVSQPYVNPMIAAAGGAVAGAAVAHAAHDDHGHHDAHAPEAHGHDDHAADGHHDDHGHPADHGADHGHGHDAHPVAHHPEPAHGHDDHGHDTHAADAPAPPQAHAHDDHGHGDHGSDHGHGHDAHPVAHHPEPAHGHDDHGQDAHAADAHAPETHAQDDHGHGEHGHGADHHHPEPAHA